jgi:hAT family C-terminal dimerisation region
MLSGLLDQYKDYSEQISHIKMCMSRLKNEYRTFYVPSNTIGMPESANTLTSDLPRQSRPVIPKIASALSDSHAGVHLQAANSPLKEFTRRYHQNSHSTNPSQELEEYLQLKPEPWEYCDPIAWWGSRSVTQLPNLSKLARDIFSIPGMFLNALLKYNLIFFY